MYNIKLFNKIAGCGLKLFESSRYNCSDGHNDYDGILVRSASLLETEFSPNLKAIARAGIGVNNVPIDKCSQTGVVVFNTPGANANAVKEIVIAGLLLSSRKINDSIQWAATLKDKGDAVPELVEKGKSAFTGPELQGKTLGVVGLGAIGVMVANAANSLGMKVYGYDPYISVESAWGLSRSVLHASNLNTIFAKCDYITLHVPLNAETKGMINTLTLASMKDGVRILNFARGDLVKDADIAAELESGKVACYVTDFPNAAVLAMKNMIAIPHLGASTPESEDNCAVYACKEIIDYLEQGIIKNSVNFPNMELPKANQHRICVLHQNIPNVIAQVSSVLSAKGINIESMTNKSKKDNAYSVFDFDGSCPPEIESELAKVKGVVKVRVL